MLIDSNIITTNAAKICDAKTYRVTDVTVSSTIRLKRNEHYDWSCSNIHYAHTQMT